MKNILALHLCLAFALAASAGEIASAFGVLDMSRAQPALAITKGNPEHTAISLSSPAVFSRDTLIGFDSYRLYALAGEPFEEVDGRPCIPQVTRLYHIPNTGAVELRLAQAEFDLVENVDVLPLQADANRFLTQLRRDPVVYEAEGWYPAEPAVMSAPLIYRDFRVVQVTLYPVQVNTRTRQVRVYRDLSAEIVANGTPGENELLNPRRPSGAFAPLYRAHIANLDERALDGATDTPGSYLILCRDSSIPRQWSDTLATWLRRRGYYVTIDARASWNQTTMRLAVQNLYNSANPPLEFVCIMGDPQASFGLPTGGTGLEGGYDHVFASLTSDDIEDVGVGRLSASNATEFNTIFAKIVAYECTPYMDDPSWYHRAFLYAGTANGISSNQILWNWAQRQFQRLTGVTNCTVATHGGSVSNSLVATRLNEGVSFFLWRGTVVGEMTNSCASTPNNGSKLPVVLTITCGSGDFDQGVGLSESWLLAGSASSLKGGICGIGTATYGTHVQYNNTVAGGLVYNICNLGVEHVSVALAGAKAQVYAAFPGYATDAAHFSRWNNLIGEPSLSMWTDQPVVMNVTYPAAVNVGTRRVRPQVINQATSTPIENALVVLWKGAECYAVTLSDQFGFADVPVTVLTPGTMTLTVTKRNHKPFLADISCVAAPMMVAYSSVSLDDDMAGGTQGNANGVLNPGEIIDLPIYLRNFGTSVTATSVSAVLTSNHPDVAVVNGTCSYPDIPAADSAVCAAPFRIVVAPTMRHDVRALLTLAVTAGGELTHSSIPLTCKAGHPIFETSQVLGGNGNSILEPGETAQLRLTVRNIGELALDGVSGRLVSSSSYVSVISGTASFGSVPIGGTASNSGQEFQVRANSHTYPGHSAALMLILTTTGGHVDTVSFALTVGWRTSTDPTGPDAYGYFAYENTDVAYDPTRPYEYFNINAGLGTNLNLNDPGEEVPYSPIYSVLRTLPFPFRFYGENYNQITICANGWAAFGDQSYLDQFRNYPIPGQQAPDAMIAPFWDDLKTYATGLGVWDYNDAANHRYIVQWRARGAYQSNLQDFEVILLDPLFYPTRDGNGIIIVQYASVAEMTGQNDVPYSTIGIQAPGGVVGLQYRFGNTAASGAGSLVSGRSVVFTTESHATFGNVVGVVTDAATLDPLSGAVVSLDESGVSDTTDTSGRYELMMILTGTYTVRAAKAGYNDGVVNNVVVEMDSTATVNFSLLHPEISLSVSEIVVSLPHDPATAYFNLDNSGNGPLDYQITIQFNPGGSLDGRWDYLTGFDAEAATGDQLIQGCELVGDYWWLSGGGSATGQRVLYKFDLSGNYVGSVPQPSNAGLGWFDMATDGQWLYGSNSEYIIAVDQSGTVQASIPSPVNPSRAVAYNPQTDHFWVADYLTDIYEISRDGTLYRQLPAPGAVTGLAWNPQDADGYHLYVFGRDNGGEHARVYRMHPASGDTQLLAQLDRQMGDRSGGCTVTGGWNSTLLVFAGILQNTASDLFAVWELDFNTTWISVTPMFGSVPAGAMREMEVAFNPATLRDGTYRVNLSIRNNSATPLVTLPVTLAVSLAADEPQIAPLTYALDQNYPNPFNSRTTFRYSLAQTGFATLRIYNLLGQEVATVADGLQTAGVHTASYDMNSLPSGVYVYRLESGSFSDVRKMMLIR